MSKKKHSSETKAAVLAALMTGQAATYVAKEYNIPIGTVKSWKRRQRAQRDASDATQKKEEDIGELLLIYLQESIKTLTEQVKHFRNREWLMKQEAESLAMLHGVQTDKAMRMIEAMDRAESSD